MQGIFQKENTDKALKYGIYRHLPTYEKIIRNLVSFFYRKKREKTSNKAIFGFRTFLKYQNIRLLKIGYLCVKK